MSWRTARLLVAATLLLIACRESDDGEEEPTEDQAYFCDQYARYWCPAFLSCNESGFYQSFHDYEECVELTERDCLDPPEGFEPCRGVTQEEADACAQYIQDNITDGCNNLFGRNADMSPCEDICD